MQGFELLQAGRTMFEMAARYGLNVQDVGLLEAYKHYKQLQATREKQEYIFAVMREDYGIGRTAVLSMVKRFEQVII